MSKELKKTYVSGSYSTDSTEITWYIFIIIFKEGRKLLWFAIYIPAHQVTSEKRSILKGK